MAEILGLGVTHSPSLIAPDELKNYSLTRALRNERIPSEQKNPENWPDAMRKEWGDDEGYTSALFQREKLVAGFRKVRAELDAFKPDVVLVWGDDQYENFKEDIIPAFCVMAYDEYECRPFTTKDGGTRPNVWGEAADKTFLYKGHPAARHLAGALIDDGFDVAYAYKALHEQGLGHAFLNTLLYLDYDRIGFDYPVIPFAINCYGSRVIRNRGGATPQTSPWRVALIASRLTAWRCPPTWMCLAGVVAEALHGAGSRGCPGHAGQPVAGGADRIVQLVPRVPDGKELVDVLRRGIGPGTVRGVPGRQLRGLARPHHGAGGGRRAAGDAELDVPGRRAV